MFFDLRNSLSEMELLRREIDNIFSKTGHYRDNSFPLTNIYQNEDHITLVSELPGLTKDDINIELHNNVLTISGNREEKKYGEKAVTLRSERNSGEFKKTFKIPVEVNRDEISANFTDGILTVQLPKAEEAKPKKISIQA